MAADTILRGEYSEAVRRLDEKIETIGEEMRELKQQVAADSTRTQADIRELTRTINRWGGAIAVLTVIAMLILARLIQLVGF